MNEKNVNTDSFLSREQLEELCSELLKSSQKVQFETGNVPENLNVLIPYAEIWGLSDDWKREELIEKTPELVKENLKLTVTHLEDEMDAWLAGEEALSINPSDAYIAFSSLRMAVDFI